MAEIIQGDALARLREMSSQTVQCCVTSPPYFGLRDYGEEGQIGLESTPDEYVARLVEVFGEVKRVLRDNGTLWLNLGDSYCSARGNPGPNSVDEKQAARRGWERPQDWPMDGYKQKDLLGIPWMVAFALRADGWYLRSEIIWAKPNPMPESVTDRPTKAHEQVFLLSKSPRYYYDADAIKEPQSPASFADSLRRRPSERSNGASPDRGPGDQGLRSNGVWLDGMRNRRSVWTVATQPYPEAHFATFPPKLIEPMILAGCPRECCGVCGAPWERVVGREPMVVRPTAKRADWQAHDGHARTQVGGTMTSPPRSTTTGWRATCDHDDRTGHGVVLDPFAGSGTTLQVAEANGRTGLGIELNPGYVALAYRRLEGVTPSMFDPIVSAATTESA